MFGLTAEKLFLVALIAVVVIGPRRLPDVAARVAGVVRDLTVRAGEAARRAESESGVADIRAEWTALDPRQYDPRRIVREAWEASAVQDAPDTSDSAQSVDAGGPAPTPARGRWVTAGSSGHPRRVWVPAEE